MNNFRLKDLMQVLGSDTKVSVHSICDNETSFKTTFLEEDCIFNIQHNDWHGSKYADYLVHFIYSCEKDMMIIALNEDN